MRPTVLVPLANGFEEIEAITIIDVLRRANIRVITAGLDRDRVVGAHGIEVGADMRLEEVESSSCDMVVLPGGMPGAQHLLEDEKLKSLVQSFNYNNKRIGAICASPWVLSEMGVLKDNYTCYPSFEKRILKGQYHPDCAVVSDHNIITASGPSSAMEFALEIVKELTDDSTYRSVKEGLLFA
ncbi:MAG: DJ-1/PfpI family protein [Campylobacteraceae bacterium]|nr:DJ-1/PfpI family protein [Campylobacteraceae bacterium]